MKGFSVLFSILLLVCYSACNAVTAHAEWTKIDLGQAYKNADIFDVWGDTGADMFAVGMNFEDGKWEDRYGLILHYDGTIWHEMEGPNARWLYCVWGSSGSDIFVGGEEVTGNELGGAILHYDGTAWTEMIHPHLSGNWVDDIWGTSASDVYAVGAGRILHYDGSSWTTSYQSTNPFFLFTSIWGNAATDVFACGFFSEGEFENYVILHYDGSQWREMATGPGGRLLNIWGSSGTDVFAVGYPGIIHYDGTAWIKMNGFSDAPQEYIYSVWGTSPSNVFVGGLDGHIHHYEGTSWTDQINIGQALWNIWGQHDMYAVGNSSSFLHYADAIPEPPMLNIVTSGINVKATWTRAIGVHGTILSYAPYPFTGMQSIVSVDMGAKTSLSIDLWEGAAFYVAVQTYNSFGSSDFSNIELFVLGP